MSEPDYNQIRQRVEQRFNKQKELTIHTTVYIIINALLWALFFTGIADAIPVLNGLNSAFGVMLPLMVSVGWGVGLVAHFLDYYYSVGGGARRREQTIEREIEREMALRAEYEKPKRERNLRLTEDGEIEEMTDDEEYSRVERRRR